MPNPTNDRTHFHIAQIDESIDSASTVEVQIISSNGVVVYEGDGSLDQVNRKLDVVMQNLGIGIYVVQISNGKYRESYRIAKM